MIDIIARLACFDQSVDKTTAKELSRIIVAMLTMTGWVTMLGISRWTEKGGSYRTVQRIFGKRRSGKKYVSPEPANQMNGALHKPCIY